MCLHSRFTYLLYLSHSPLTLEIFSVCCSFFFLLLMLLLLLFFIKVCRDNTTAKTTTTTTKTTKFFIKIAIKISKHCCFSSFSLSFSLLSNSSQTELQACKLLHKEGEFFLLFLLFFLLLSFSPSLALLLCLYLIKYSTD